jgi:hypothetical protein
MQQFIGVSFALVVGINVIELINRQPICNRPSEICNKLSQYNRPATTFHFPLSTFHLSSALMS